MKHYRRVKQFVRENPWTTEPGVRWWIHNEKNNGLAEEGAIVRVGGVVLIDVPRFERWIEKHRNRAA